ncbi:MAG: NAD(P)-dependent oxidoreductase [Hyphomicrobiaceae bacterium]
MIKISKLGFIGLGVMGGRMCRNLTHRSGLSVIAYDIDPSKQRALSDIGVETARSIADVTAQAELIFICLPGEPQVREVAFAPDGLVSRARHGQTIVDMTTATVEINREVAAALDKKGADFADAPVARGVSAAEDGTLAITVGAAKEVFQRIEPYLAFMGSQISHCGGIGNGQIMKLMNNMIIFQTVTALAEAMAIATRAGVDRSEVFEILSKGSADSFVMRKHGQHMATRHYPDDQFPAIYSLKDIRYALSLAKTVGVDAQSAKLAEQRLLEAIERGYGHLYSPVIYELFENGDKTVGS